MNMSCLQLASTKNTISPTCPPHPQRASCWRGQRASCASHPRAAPSQPHGVRGPRGRVRSRRRAPAQPHDNVSVPGMFCVRSRACCMAGHNMCRAPSSQHKSLNGWKQKVLKSRRPALPPATGCLKLLHAHSVAHNAQHWLYDQAASGVDIDNSQPSRAINRPVQWWLMPGGRGPGWIGSWTQALPAPSQPLPQPAGRTISHMPFFSIAFS